LGKWGVIVAFLGAVTIVPTVIAYVFGLLFSLDLSIIRDTLPLLGRTVLYGLIIALSAGTSMLALSSLSRNSRYVALFWLALWIGTGVTSTILKGIDAEQRFHDLRRRDVSLFSDDHVKAELDAAGENWRPMMSYTSNLYRVGQELMGTTAAWDAIVRLLPAQGRPMLQMSYLDARYPWTWSAAVLFVLFVISAWILNRSIRSLDRLK
jgi:hypothetical protein